MLLSTFIHRPSTHSEEGKMTSQLTCIHCARANTKECGRKKVWEEIRFDIYCQIDSLRLPDTGVAPRQSSGRMFGHFFKLLLLHSRSYSWWNWNASSPWKSRGLICIWKCHQSPRRHSGEQQNGWNCNFSLNCPFKLGSITGPWFHLEGLRCCWPAKWFSHFDPLWSESIMIKCEIIWPPCWDYQAGWHVQVKSNGHENQRFGSMLELYRFIPI